jgi:hypothetical protein
MSQPLPPLDSQLAAPAPQPAHDPAQASVPQAPESPLASQLPAWDLLPPTSFVRKKRIP